MQCQKVWETAYEKLSYWLRVYVLERAMKIEILGVLLHHIAWQKWRLVSHMYLKRRCKESWARLFSVMLSGRTRGSGCKLEHRRFLNCRKHVFAVRVTKKWHRFPEIWWSLYSCRCLEAVWTQTRATLPNNLSMSLWGNDTAWRKANGSPLKQSISCKEWELLLLSEGLLTNKSRLKKSFVGNRKQWGSGMVSQLV